MKAKQLETGARYLLALALLVFGADKFLHFMPQPAPPEEGGQYLGALLDAGFIFPTIGIVFIASALLLISRRVLFALILVSPVLVNIVLYHLRYDVPGIGPGAVLAVLVAILFALHVRSLGALLQANELR